MHRHSCITQFRYRDDRTEVSDPSPSGKTYKTHGPDAPWSARARGDMYADVDAVCWTVTRVLTSCEPDPAVMLLACGGLASDPPPCSGDRGQMEMSLRILIKKAATRLHWSLALCTDHTSSYM